MPTMIVLGYRKGIDQAVTRRGLEPLHVVHKIKSGLAGRPFQLVSDIEDAQEVLRAVLTANPQDVVGVVTGHEEGVFTAAYLRERLDLPGNRDSTAALRFRDKYLQKGALPASTRRARCRRVDRNTTFADLRDDLGLPFVVKPANGSGSLRTAVVADGEELAAVVDAAPRRSDVEFVAESFVSGPEIHLDAVWYDGALRWTSVGRYHSAPLHWSDGGTLASQVLAREQNPQVFARIEELARQALPALGAPDAVIHLEAFEQDEGLTFGECAIRLPGAHTPEIIELTYGVNLYDVEVSIALGESPDPWLQPRRPDAYHAYIYLRRHPHVVLSQEEYEKRFDFVEIDYPSDPDAPVGSYGRVGYAILGDPDNARLRRTLDRIVTFSEHGHD